METGIQDKVFIGYQQVNSLKKFKKMFLITIFMLFAFSLIDAQESPKENLDKQTNVLEKEGIEKEHSDKAKEQENKESNEAKEDSEKKESEISAFPEEKPIQVTGSTSFRYRLKTTDGESDQDIYGDLNFQIKNIVPDKISFHFYGRAYLDVEGNQHENDNRTDFFRDIYDGYNSYIEARLYHAYLSLENYLFDDSLFNIGRQTVYLNHAYDFDGAYGEVRLHKALKVSVFGGASNYNFKGPRGGDWLVGTGIELTPMQGTKFTANYLYVAEDSKEEGLDDYQFIFQLRQQVWKNCFLSSQLTVLNDQARDMSISSIFNFPEYDLQVNLRFYALFNEMENLTSSVSYYFGVYKPYQQYEVHVYKGLGEYFSISAGYMLRVLDHERDEGEFNREFQRYYITGTMQDLLTKGLEISLSFQGWLSEGVSDNDLFGVDAEIAYKFTKQLRGSLGTSYELYQYEIYLDEIEERVGLTSIYTKWKYEMNKTWSFYGKFEWQYDEERDYFQAELGITAQF